MAQRYRVLAALFLAVPLLVSCKGPDHEKYCEKWNACHAGNDKDEEACVVRRDADYDSATVQGCNEEYNDYFECLLDNIECREGQLVKSNEEACKSETSALQHCSPGAVEVD
jgi:hypothetical protein